MARGVRSKTDLEGVVVADDAASLRAVAVDLTDRCVGGT